MERSSLDEIPWVSLRDAFGPATDVPTLLSRVLDGDELSAKAALQQLWGTIWHQGTVYECTPYTVPFLAEAMGSERLSDATRAEIGILLSSIAAPTSYVVASTMHWARGWSDQVEAVDPATDLAVICKQRVTAALPAVSASGRSGSPTVRAGVISVLAAVAPDDGQQVLELADLGDGDDAFLELAVEITKAIADAPHALRSLLADAARLDEGLADLLGSLEQLPVLTRAVEAVRELCINSIGG